MTQAISEGYALGEHPSWEVIAKRCARDFVQVAAVLERVGPMRCEEIAAATGLAERRVWGAAMSGVDHGWLLRRREDDEFTLLASYRLTQQAIQQADRAFAGV